MVRTARSIYTDLGLPGTNELLGVPIDPWTMGQTLNAAQALIEAKVFAHLIGVNADKVLQMRDDSTMADTVRRREIVNADGASMIIASKILRRPLPERVAGIDLMGQLCALSAAQDYPVYLLGAKADVVKKTAEALVRDYPGLGIVGFRDGYFDESEYDAIISQVLATKPVVVFVGITSPKKEEIIERFRDRGAHSVFVGVGGSFDVISGLIPRAPQWMQRLNIEWVFRMVQEPKRLVKRYLVGNTRFIGLVLKEALGGSKHG